MRRAPTPPSTDWSGTQRWRPLRTELPASEPEVRRVVREAREQGRRVKVAGASHSWSGIQATDGVAVSLDRMGRVLAIDRERGTARVEAGIRLKQLKLSLLEQGLSLPILGSIAKQSLAGVISTATHGSSLAWGNLSSFVRGLRVVTADGAAHEIRADDPRLDAFRVSLGALGIVTEIEIDVVPAFRLATESSALPFDALCAELPAIARSAEFVKAWWLPDTGRAVVFRSERTEEPETFSPVARWLDQHVVNLLLFEGLLRLGARAPALVPPINRSIGALYFRPAREVARADLTFNIAMPPKHRETEHAYALEDVSQALLQLEERIRKERLRVNFVVEIRFVKGDGGWMSPAYGRDVAQVGIYQAESRDLPAYFAAAEEIARRSGARPHWGKETALDRAYVERAFPRAKDFLRLRDELDPGRLFGNAFLAQVLGP